MESMMFCIGKKDGNVYRVYDITYDRSGYPMFLIYDGGAWVRRSAKNFIPAEVMVPEDEFEDGYEDGCDGECGYDCGSCGSHARILQ